MLKFVVLAIFVIGSASALSEVGERCLGAILDQAVELKALQLECDAAGLEGEACLALRPNIQSDMEAKCAGLEGEEYEEVKNLVTEKLVEAGLHRHAE